ncbi:amino acid adenylation domain-containing protein [Micromonospora sp. NPDC049051]|uniref:amino acid adenylation domain-containing protein n=1 Tax=Micromonospora sp. NPDC049051 TaxID=3364264 RepID=UPI0037107FBB
MSGFQAGHEPVIEDLYPLTPLQQGMLFHTLKSPLNGPYLEQFVFDLGGPVDVAALTRAWTTTVRRHPALRTSFMWEGLDEPHQAVLTIGTVPLTEHDHRLLDDVDHSRLLEEFLAADRTAGIPLHRAPLMRLTLFHRPAGAVLVWTLHHLILDGWSFPTVIRETAAAYRADVAGQPLSLAPAPPFRDFIGWLARRDTRQDAVYWRAYLNGPSAASTVSVGPPAEGERRGRAADGRAVHDLGSELSLAVSTLAANARVTLGTVFQAAWAALLARHNGTRDVVYGLTMAGRPADMPGVGDIVGPFINTVPRRADLQPGEPIVDWLRRVQTDRLDVEQHQHTSLVDIHKYAGRSAEDTLFDTILVIENYPSVSSDWALDEDVRFELRTFLEDTGYPLTVLVLPRAEGLRVQILYDRERFANDVVEALLGRFETVLRTLTTGSLVGDVDVIDAAERKRLLTMWNSTEAELDQRPVQQVVAEQFRRTPHAIALDDHGRLLTYAELDQRSARLAAALVEAGVGPGVVVAILQRRTAELLISALAVLRAGGAYLALDPDHPDPRLSYLLTDSAAALLLTDTSFNHRLGPNPTRLRVDELAEIPVATAHVVDVSPDDLCYITYTSGSTGRPKGIAMSHRAGANLISWQVRHTSVPPTARTFAYASLSFDVSFQEIFATWTVGGQLILVDEDERMDFERLVALAAASQVQRWYLPAFALEQVAATAARLGTTLPELRELIPGSEPLHVTDELRRLLAAAPGCRLENQYGPSECHVVTSHVVAEPPARMDDHPHLGWPLANTRAFILDRELRPVPMGVPGNLYLAGAGVAHGYLGRTALTADRFVPCPFPRRPGERMYDTGDRARLRPDGGIEFLGRLDNQIKIRGFRIELGEIESLLREQDEIREAVVLLREVNGERRLVGYVLGARADIEVAVVLERLRRTVPDHLVPWTLMVLESFPFTVNRKVDRAALPTPQVAPGIAAEDTADRSPAEQLMSDLWARVLGVSSVGLDDDFFRLGGHSLTAVKLTGRVRAAFDTPIGVGAVFSLRTPRRLLERVSTELGGEQAATAAAQRFIDALSSEER